MFRRSGVKNSLVESFNKCVLFYRSFSEQLDTETDGKNFKNAACFYPILVDVDD